MPVAFASILGSLETVRAVSLASRLPHATALAWTDIVPPEMRVTPVPTLGAAARSRRSLGSCKVARVAPGGDKLLVGGGPVSPGLYNLRLRIEGELRRGLRFERVVLRTLTAGVPPAS
jgi:hypothetical protein